MNNFDSNSEKMIGARVPVEFADRFSDYCKEKGIKQNVLFRNLFKWWLDGIDDSIQWLIYRGKTKEAHQQIAEEVAAQADADAIVTGAEADSARQARKKGRGRRAKTG